VRLQNYANYQSVCLAQNIDDIAQDVLQTKIHMNGLHSEIDSLENNQEHLKSQLVQILEKLDTIQTVVQSLKDSFEQEKETPSPIKFDDIERHASFNWFGNSVLKMNKSI
jgi:chromosome segregation ATPase